MRLITILWILFSSAVTISAQDIVIQHDVQPNTTYLWSLAMSLEKEVEEIRNYDRHGASMYSADFITRKDSSFLQVYVKTTAPKAGNVPFIATVDALHYSTSQKDELNSNALAEVSDIMIHGNFSTFQRMVVDSITGAANQDQHDRLYAMLDEVYRSMRWPSKGLAKDIPILKTSETQMLKSSSSYSLKELEGNRAIIDFLDNKHGLADGEEKDRTEIEGTIIFNTKLNLIERHTYRKTFTQNITYNKAEFISDSKRVISYDWRFKLLSE